MVDMIASRKAGRALLMIVSILLIPILVFGMLYIMQAYKEIRVIDQELTGSKISQLVYPVMLAEHHEASEDVLQKVSELEKSLGVIPEEGFAAHLKAVQSKNLAKTNTPGKTSEHADHAATHGDDESLSAYLKEISDKSGLILDSDAESYYLARALLADVPQLLLNFEAMMQTSVTERQQSFNDVLSIVGLHEQIGRSLAIFEVFEASVESAQSYSARADKFSDLSKVVSNAETGLKRIISLKENKLAGTVAMRSSTLEATLSAGREFFKSTEIFHAKAFELLDLRLQERRNELSWTLMAMSAVGLVSALIALYLATQFIRKTLVKLDEVDEARVQAQRVSDEVAILNADLADKISKLSTAQEEIVKKGKMVQLGQLTATVAHELRNPLGSVRTSAFLIQRKIEGKNLGLETQLERINNGILRCDNIITQLLDYSRTKTLTLSETNLDVWLVKTVTEESNKLPARIHVECELGLAERTVPIDTARLQRAVINLMSNASEAVMSSCDKTGFEPKIWISTHLRGNMVAIRVRDNGPGISAENLVRIREPLFTTKNFGTGLGIPAIEQVALQHKGTLEISSVEGQGATFELFLPLTASVSELDLSA